ncbi:MAG TPA: OmcA/MtrC family decaheme c-type cytochrome [Polyangiales bacterium]
MRRISSYLLFGVLVAGLGACASGDKGPKGDTGDAGPKGDPGPAGTSCSVKDNGDGSKTITCANGAKVTVSDGTKGDPGAAALASLIKTSAEPVGTNCAFGGVKVQSGLDSNSSGVLDASEINATLTKYACNGGKGANAPPTLVATGAEAAGTNCAAGGTKVEFGLDANGNDTLDTSEVIAASTRFVCNGADGVAGNNGAAGLISLVKTSTEAAGANCPNGGVKIEAGVDANSSGVLDAGEINPALTTYACNGQAGLSSGSIGLVVAVKSVSTTAPIAVRFTLKDSRGNPVDMAGGYSSNLPMSLSFSIAYADTVTDINGVVNRQPYTVLTASNSTSALTSFSPTTYSAVGSTSSTTITPARGTLVENGVGAGDYTYTFPATDLKQIAVASTGKATAGTTTTLTDSAAKWTVNQLTGVVVTLTSGANANQTCTVASNTATVLTCATALGSAIAAGDGYSIPQYPNGVVYKGVTYDPTKSALTHTVWIATTRQTNLDNATDPAGFTAVNAQSNIVPAGGTPVAREVTLTTNCYKCHGDHFPTEGSTTNGFHSGARVVSNYCPICHNPARASTPAGTSAAIASTFIHRIHNGAAIQPANAFHNIVATYPQDIRNCDACHKGAAQGDQWKTNPSIAACTSCHDQVDFTGTVATTCQHGPVTMTAPVTVTSTATSGALTTLTDSTKTWAVNQFLGGLATITSGANKGAFCHVASNTATAITCESALPAAIAAGDGYTLTTRANIPAPCKHTGGIKADGTCAGCHNNTAGAVSNIVDAHKPVEPPDPNNSLLVSGGNANTNAAYIAASGYVPTGASVITYGVTSVAAVATVPASANKNPQIKFKLLKDGAPVVFNTYVDATTELITGFVGSPSVYFAWALPQDGIATPADFNASASAYIKSVWAAPTGASATFAGPDANGDYTITLTGTLLPATATMLTGGVGYTYSLTSTQPLTQTNVPAYPYVASNKQGGILVPAHDVWKTATGFTARRTVVDNNQCLDCHGALGISPTFHAGQRNDAPTCSFCHNPNRTSSGWSANVKDFIHSIHGGRKRTVDFNWHAAAPGGGFGDVEFPSPLNDCMSCHVAGGYDFSTSTAQAALPNMLMSTAATGRFKTDPNLNPTGWFSVSPYVQGNNLTDYGTGYSTSNLTQTLPDGNSGTGFDIGGNPITCTLAAPCVCTTANPCTVTSVVGTQKVGSVTNNCTAGTPCTCTTASTCSVPIATCTNAAPCEAAQTTLVKSPITAACSACHDSPVAVDHMTNNGGHFWDTRSNTQSAGPEQCLICHGPGKVAAIATVHK